MKMFEMTEAKDSKAGKHVILEGDDGSDIPAYVLEDYVTRMVIQIEETGTIIAIEKYVQ